MTYTQHEKSKAATWKRTTPTLPEAARADAAYVDKDGQARGPDRDFCVPPAFSNLSLLPEVREPALALFAALGIPWHAGIDGGPSNHLVSSQVQCVNALGQMVHDPQRVKLAFGELLGIDEVLEVEPGRFLTIEYIGPEDWFGESHKVRVIEDGREAVADSHPADVLLCVVNLSLDKIDSLAAEGHSVVTTRLQPEARRWIRAKAQSPPGRHCHWN